MIFTAPLPFDEAVEHGAVKVILPTALKSAEAKEHLSAEVLERSRFSSQIVNAELLNDLDQEVEKLVQGTTDMATARNFLRARARSYGYKPQPGKEGTIEDFTSNVRLKLTLGTCVQMAQGYGQYMQGQDPTVLDLYPAQELYRGQRRKKPRNWVARWSQAAKATHTKVSGFTALKNTLIWTAISAFGNPYWPYDYGSGMRTRDKSRAEAMADGLIDRDTQIRPENRGFNQDLAFSPSIRSQQLRQAIVDGGDGKLYFDGTGALRLRDEKRAGNEADAARAVVESYDPENPATWAISDEERATLSAEEVEQLALKRYLDALFNGDATPVQSAGNATPHRSKEQLCAA